MKSEELLHKISNIRTWKKKDERAPHKPLLILYMLGKLLNEDKRLIPYETIKSELKHLLDEFGPPRANHQPKYPFLRLANDGIWEVKGNIHIDTTKDYKEKELLEYNVYGGFLPEVYSLLMDNHELVRKIANQVLNDNFPESLHDDILNEIGLDLVTPKRIQRNPWFRELVLRAYEYRCAVCGFDVRLGQTLVAVEAAHIKWHQAGGPDEESNGIALCALHHKLFDRGVFTIDNLMTFKVAEKAHGTKGFQEWLMNFHGKQIQLPQAPQYEPAPSYLNWHVREVFKGPVRHLY